MIPSRGGTCWSKCDGCDACVAIKELEDLVWTLASMDANEAAKMAMPEYLTMMKAIQVARRAVSFAQQEGIQRRVWWGQSLSSAVDDVAVGTEVLPEKWRTTPAKVKGLLDVIGKDPRLPELLTELLDRTTLETVKACQAAHASGISWREIDPDNPPEQRASEVVQPEWENPFPKPAERHWQIARQWINGTGAGTSRLMKERTLAALLAYEHTQMPEHLDNQRTSEARCPAIYVSNGRESRCDHASGHPGDHENIMHGWRLRVHREPNCDWGAPHGGECVPVSQPQRANEARLPSEDAQELIAEAFGVEDGIVSGKTMTDAILMIRTLHRERAEAIGDRAELQAKTVLIRRALDRDVLADLARESDQRLDKAPNDERGTDK